MTAAWTRKEGKSESGGLNEKGRASLRAQGHDIKRPQPEGGSRKDSFSDLSLLPDEVHRYAQQHDEQSGPGKIRFVEQQQKLNHARQQDVGGR